MRSFRRLLSFFPTGLVLLGNAAADLTGTWSTTCEMPDGTHHESTLNLQVNGGKVSGKIVSKRGTAPILDGTVDGNGIVFYVVRVGNGDELKVEFRGTVQGEAMKLRMQYRDHAPVLLTARRGAVK